MRSLRETSGDPIIVITSPCKFCTKDLFSHVQSLSIIKSTGATNLLKMTTRKKRSCCVSCVVLMKNCKDVGSEKCLHTKQLFEFSAHWSPYNDYTDSQKNWQAQRHPHSHHSSLSLFDDKNH